MALKLFILSQSTKNKVFSTWNLFWIFSYCSVLYTFPITVWVVSSDSSSTPHATKVSRNDSYFSRFALAFLADVTGDSGHQVSIAKFDISSAKVRFFLNYNLTFKPWLHFWKIIWSPKFSFARYSSMWMSLTPNKLVDSVILAAILSPSIIGIISSSSKASFARTHSFTVAPKTTEKFKNLETLKTYPEYKWQE